MAANFNTCKLHLERHLSKAGYNHSLGAWRLMERVAPIYGLDPEAARWAGLMHDVASEIPVPELLMFMRHYAPQAIAALPEKCRIGRYLHGPAGATMLRKLWEFPDASVMLAIEQHMGNYLDMPTLSRCLHVADAIASTSDFPGRGKLEKELLAGELDKAELTLDVWSVQCMLDSGIPIHPAYQEKIRRLNAHVSPTKKVLARTSA